MLKKILIANRGEIALRIIRTARRLGVRTVAVASEPDRRAPFAIVADELVEIGPGRATESYLDIAKIIAAAKHMGADGIHPGYGFLAENAAFAEAAGKAGIRFIGPSPDAMRRMGGKAEAKAIAAEAGVPVVPGYHGDEQDAKTLAAEAKRIGYPVMIKAVAGGGGRGMRLVEAEKDLAGLLESAQREAQAAFGDARVLLEKVIAAPRHIEVQVFGDSHGNVVHLFERDCTLQRRNQKVIEEAPAPGMSPELRAKICAAAVACARAVRYEGAGTVEFLVEGGKLSAEAPWYFIEMNTRLQVEHPVTETITGLDLVEWQLRVASGERLPLAQDAIEMSGHAIEARLCAENPAKGFLPSTGPIAAFEVPEHERPAGGCGCGGGLGDLALLRFHDRQADRQRPRPRHGDCAPCRRAEGNGGGRAQDQRRVPACAGNPARVRRGAHGHGADRPRACRAGAEGHRPQGHRLRRHAHAVAGPRRCRADGPRRRRLFALERAGRISARRPQAAAGDGAGRQRGDHAWR